MINGQTKNKSNARNIYSFIGYKNLAKNIIYKLSREKYFYNASKICFKYNIKYKKRNAISYNKITFSDGHNTCRRCPW